MVTHMQGATRGEARHMSALERSVDIVPVVNGLLHQIGAQNADADGAENLAGDAHQRGGFGYGSLADHGKGQGLQWGTHTTQAQTPDNHPGFEALSTPMP